MDGNLHRLTFSPTACCSQEELRQYLDGSMNRDGIRRVENHLLDCPLCSDAVDGFETLNGEHMTDDLEDFESFRKKLPTVTEAKVRQLKPANYYLRRVAAIAAVMVIGAVGYYFGFGQSATGSQLYDKYYTYYKNDIPVTLRRPGISDVDPNFGQGLVSYDERKFVQANMLFERALHAQPDNEALKFFAGLSYLETNQADKAKSLLDAVATGTGVYAKKAAWYSIMCDLKAKKKDEARAKLDKFIEDGQIMVVEAKALREKL